MEYQLPFSELPAILTPTNRFDSSRALRTIHHLLMEPVTAILVVREEGGVGRSKVPRLDNEAIATSSVTWRTVLLRKDSWVTVSGIEADVLRRPLGRSSLMHSVDDQRGCGNTTFVIPRHNCRLTVTPLVWKMIALSSPSGLWNSSRNFANGHIFPLM